MYVVLVFKSEKQKVSKISTEIQTPYISTHQI